MVKLPWKRPVVYEIARSVVDGKEVVYNFTNPLPLDRAQEEFRRAVQQGLPSGSVIIVG
jgi:hypothetical protein